MCGVRACAGNSCRLCTRTRRRTDWVRVDSNAHPLPTSVLPTLHILTRAMLAPLSRAVPSCDPPDPPPPFFLCLATKTLRCLHSGARAVALVVVIRWRLDRLLWEGDRGYAALSSVARKHGGKAYVFCQHADGLLVLYTALLPTQRQYTW
jgi:hypothetical protein